MQVVAFSLNGDWLSANADWISAIGTVLSAVAAMAALLVAGLSIYEVRRVDDRAKTREQNERDDALQARLESLYPQLYSTLGSPKDGIPLESRLAMVSFFGLYADVFTSKRDGLLRSPDQQAFVNEFEFWVKTPQGRQAWDSFRRQSWPAGFKDHLDELMGSREEPYAQLALSPPQRYWLKDGLQVEIQECGDDVNLERALASLEALRVRNAVEVPPSNKYDPDPNVRRKAYLEWLFSTGPKWNRWVATAGEQIVGHVLVSDPFDYMSLLAKGLPQDTLEISRVWVHPLLQRQQLGTVLMDRATAFVRGLGATPALAVLDQGPSSFYRDLGWMEYGQFNGVQGLNRVMTC